MRTKMVDCSLVYSLKFHFILAFLIRLLFTLYGIAHDAYCDDQTNGKCVKYTDIDYRVFTDAARYIYEGESPYKRETYRYTPILAIILQPNIWLWKSYGKFLFILFDLLCGLTIININKTDRLKSICFWFYNPITIAISSRGNAESIMSFLVLSFVWSYQQRKYAIAGCLYALAIHFKIYPIIYSLVILFNLILTKPDEPKKYISFVVRFLCAVKRLLSFGISFLLTIAALTYYFYHKYGYEFLYETYIYHLSRKDIRHNFSPYFYLYNLYNFDEQWSLYLKLISFLPQAAIIFTCSCCLYQSHHFNFCLFFITYAFVTFNKVCTSQYFVWYLSLIPIIIPSLKVSLAKAVKYFLIWIFGQALWLFHAYQLEFNGQNKFFELFLASLVFLFLNCFIMKYLFIESYNWTKRDVNDEQRRRTGKDRSKLKTN